MAGWLRMPGRRPGWWELRCLWAKPMDQMVADDHDACGRSPWVGWWPTIMVVSDAWWLAIGGPRWWYNSARTVFRAWIVRARVKTLYAFGLAVGDGARGHHPLVEATVAATPSSPEHSG
ncbi:hypothetical protein ACQJBY_050978 [Aegilops geniculata]